MICWVVERKEQEDVKEKEQGEKRKEKEKVQRKNVKKGTVEKEQEDVRYYSLSTCLQHLSTV